MRVLLIKTGTTVPQVAEQRGDFESWFAAGMGLPRENFEVTEVFRGAALPNAETFSACVITGSAAMATDNEAWSVQTERWLAKAVALGKPILGVCYGHQLLARALGGRVSTNPAGRQIGTVDVTLTELGRVDPLFRQLPATLHVPVSHSQVVTGLPKHARVLATTQADSNHAFALGSHVWGIQFHPEFDAEIIRGYIAARRDAIMAEGLDADAATVAARDTNDGKQVLRAFTKQIEANL